MGNETLAGVDIVFRIAGAQDVRGKIIVLTMEMKMASFEYLLI